MTSEEQHPALSSLSWLVGKWESVEAEVFYPDMKTIQYQEVMEYLPTNQPVLEYKSETWHGDKSKILHRERGFLRIDTESNKCALMVSHIVGFVELSEGTVKNESLTVENSLFSRVPFCIFTDPIKAIRKLWLKDGELHSTIDMQKGEYPLQPHVRTRYRKRM